MTEHEIIQETHKKRELSTRIYLMGTKAFTRLGDISSSVLDLFVAHSETDDYYIGNWVTGYGFVNVLFPKETSRALTKQEVEKYCSMNIRIGSGPSFKLNVK